jgi:NAD(P)-dependent dehydrogenase (short-subunit alcohol dehydrogenase family)
MKAVLVAGAAGGIGEAVVRELLAGSGTIVFGTSRSAQRLAELAARLAPDHRSRFTPIAEDAGDFAGASKVAQQIEALGGVDAAVAILGRGWWTGGPLLDAPPEVWRSILGEMLTAHFAFARALIPMLSSRSGSLYLSVGGGAAFAPMRDAGLVSIAAAGQLMLTRVLACERGPALPRILELVIDGPVDTRESREIAGPAWIRDDDVARVVRELILHGATSWSPKRTDGPLIVMNARDAGSPGNENGASSDLNRRDQEHEEA